MSVPVASVPDWVPDIDKDGVEKEVAPEEEEVPSGRSWRPVDLTPVLNGTYKSPKPTVGARSDGVGLYYPGRSHVLAAESESGKTWFQLAVHAHEMRAGNGTIYVDFEDDEGGVVGRLMDMGVPLDLISKYFGYIRPEEPFNVPGGKVELAEAMGDLKPTLVTLDGVTEAMTLHGLDPLNNRDAAAFGQMLVKPITARGPAVTSLDHVTKDKDGRGRYAIGAVHKLNGLNGAMYALENKEPFGVGITGRSAIFISKDRPGQLRRWSLPQGDRKWFGDLVVASDQYVEVSIQAVQVQAKVNAARARRDLMVKVCDLLATAKDAGFSKAAIEAGVGGNHQATRYALEVLINEGYVRVEQKGQAIRHHLNRPFEGD
ncbi:AAA family ATPase [Nonomuraea sp. NPDC049480]|uniref:AAA family ATPase n=1 Tax=Nonomuraea sp. NPDC049480 TaxID=3364353 RepID=UPI00379303E4